MRVQFGPVALPPRLRQGQYQELGAGEMRALCEAVGVDQRSSTTERRRSASNRRGRRR
jgi:hypothetical protein